MTQKKVVMFSHNDWDGLSPIFIAKEAFGENLVYSKACGYNNINEEILSFLDSPEYSLEQQIFITDIGINDEVAKRLQHLHNLGQEIYLLDHHATNVHLNEFEWAYVHPELNGRKESGTSLFYATLLQNNVLVKNDFLDSYVELVRKYDTWDWYEENNMLAHDLNMLFFLIGRKEMQQMVSEGVAAGVALTELPDIFKRDIEGEKKRIERYCRAKMKNIRWVNLFNLTTAIVYLEEYHPYVADAVQEKYPETDIICMIDVGNERVSLRARKEGVTVNNIAKYFGGGGHPQAAGFQLKPEHFNEFVFHTDKLNVMNVLSR